MAGQDYNVHMQLFAEAPPPMADTPFDPRHCVANNLHKTARALSRIYAEEMRPAGLARSQFAVLGTLDRSGPLILSELADRLYMDRTTLSRNLGPLQKAGLVCLERLPTDGRAKVASLSDAGRKRFRLALRYWRKAQRRVLDLVGESEWQDLEPRLVRLRRLAR